MRCVICYHPVEQWVGGGSGYGHNPDPWPQNDTPDQEFRCCDWCNAHIVIPVRLRRTQKEGTWATT